MHYTVNTIASSAGRRDVRMQSLASRRAILSTLTVLAFPFDPSLAMSPSQKKAYEAFVVQPPQPITSQQIQRQREERVRKSFEAEESRIQVAIKLYTAAVQDQKEGRYQEALSKYESIIAQYGDFALAERSRVSRAIMEYQVGKVNDAILHLKDEEVALRGDAEVHCALAVVLYSEKPYEISLAEEQFEVAMEFDKRFGDVAYVRDGKPAWPPRMVAALEKFKNFG